MSQKDETQDIYYDITAAMITMSQQHWRRLHRNLSFMEQQWFHIGKCSMQTGMRFTFIRKGCWRRPSTELSELKAKEFALQHEKCHLNNSGTSIWVLWGKYLQERSGLALESQKLLIVFIQLEIYNSPFRIHFFVSQSGNSATFEIYFILPHAKGRKWLYIYSSSRFIPFSSPTASFISGNFCAVCSCNTASCSWSSADWIGNSFCNFVIHFRRFCTKLSLGKAAIKTETWQTYSTIIFTFHATQDLAFDHRLRQHRHRAVGDEMDADLAHLN